MEDYIPVTVIDYSKDRQKSIESKVRSFARDDDVFSTHFLCSVILTTHSLSILAEDENYLKSNGCSKCYANLENRIPEGPYFMKGGSIHQIWRLYPDTNEAFCLPLVQSPLSPDT